MNSRAAAILRTLFGSEQPRADELAERLGMPSHAVRYELDGIDAFLSQHGLPKLERSHQGIALTLDNVQRDRLEDLMGELCAEEFVLTTDERLDLEFILLLSAGERPTTSQLISERLLVSKSAVDKDMRLLKERLEPQGVSLEGQASRGRRITGDEAAIRAHACRILERHVDFAQLLGNTRDPFADALSRWLAAEGVSECIGRIAKLVTGLERNEFGRWLAYDSLRAVVLSLHVTLVRNQGGGAPLPCTGDASSAMTSREYVFALQIAQALEEHFGMELPASEVLGLATQLMGARYVTPEPYLREDWVSVQLLLDRLVQGMEDELCIPFSQDPGLLDALQEHLGPMSFRLSHGIVATETGALEFLSDCEDYLDSLMGVFRRTAHPAFRDISKNDAAYLALHFRASAERLEREARVCRVAIVCMHGTAAANLLQERIVSRFRSIRVVATATYLDTDVLNSLDIDFVITNIPLPSCALPWVLVKTSPDDTDWKAIQSMVERRPSSGGARSDNARFFAGVMDVIERHCTVEDPEALASDLSSCFAAAGCPVKAERVQPPLAQLLTEQEIRCQLAPDSWQEAIEAACAPLVETGCIDHAFVDSAIADVRREGPCFVFMPGVALIHSRAGENVRRLGISLVTFSRGVEFGHPHHDPVRVAFCLAPKDNWSHIRALGDLIQFLERTSIEALCTASNPDDVRNMLRG